MMDGSIIDLTETTEHRVARLGRLPDAPLAMPKQRLEAPPQGLLALVARLFGRGALPVGDVRRSGH